jgi:hypothetical protein
VCEMLVGTLSRAPVVCEATERYVKDVSAVDNSWEAVTLAVLSSTRKTGVQSGKSLTGPLVENAFFEDVSIWS